MTGWLCARCGTSWAPHVQQCDCAPSTTLTSNTLAYCCHPAADRTTWGMCGRCGTAAGVFITDTRDA